MSARYGMIDVCIPVFRNYELIKRQVKLFKELDHRFRIIACDNTPQAEKQSCDLDILWLTRDVDPQKTTDIVSQGEAYELMKQHASSDIVCFMESDFFWLNPNLYDDITRLFNEGKICVGTAPKNMKTIEQGGFYSDWVAKLCQMFPHRVDVPFAWGMFITRELAMTHSMEQKDERFETGHLLRDNLITKNYHSLYGFQYDSSDRDAYYFGTHEQPWGLHVFGGSHRFRINELTNFMSSTERLIQAGLSKWRT